MSNKVITGQIQQISNISEHGLELPKRPTNYVPPKIPTTPPKKN